MKLILVLFQRYGDRCMDGIMPLSPGTPIRGFIIELHSPDGTDYIPPCPPFEAAEWFPFHYETWLYYFRGPEHEELRALMEKARRKEPGYRAFLCMTMLRYQETDVVDAVYCYTFPSEYVYLDSPSDATLTRKG